MARNVTLKLETHGVLSGAAMCGHRELTDVESEPWILTAARLYVGG
jgi:hypothetical protein